MSAARCRGGDAYSRTFGSGRQAARHLASSRLRRITSRCGPLCAIALPCALCRALRRFRRRITVSARNPEGPWTGTRGDWFGAGGGRCDETADGASCGKAGGLVCGPSRYAGLLRGWRGDDGPRLFASAGSGAAVAGRDAAFGVARAGAAARGLARPCLSRSARGSRASLRLRLGARALGRAPSSWVRYLPAKRSSNSGST